MTAATITVGTVLFPQPSWQPALFWAVILQAALDENKSELEGETKESALSSIPLLIPV